MFVNYKMSDGVSYEDLFDFVLDRYGIFYMFFFVYYIYLNFLLYMYMYMVLVRMRVKVMLYCFIGFR